MPRPYNQWMPAIGMLLLLARPTQGQQAAYSIDSLRDEWNLNEHLQLIETQQDTLTVERLIDTAFANNFSTYPDFIKNYPERLKDSLVLLDPDKVYWWRLTLQNRLDRPIENWVLYTGRSNFTEVFVVDKMGRVLKTSYTGFLIPANKKDFTYGNAVRERVAFSLPRDSTVTLYGKVKVINHKPPYLRVRLAPTDFYQAWDFVKKNRYDWAFIGFLLSYIFLNLLLYFSTFDKVFLWHALFQAGIFIYLLEFFNIMPALPWLRDHPHSLPIVIYSALCLMDVACVQFIRNYMVMNKSKPDWDLRFGSFVWVRLVFAILLIGLYQVTKNTVLTDNITSVFMMVQYITIVVLLWFIFGKYDRRSYYLIGGTTLFVAGVVLNAFYILKGLGSRFTFTQIGVMGEVALFTLGLGYRMKYLQKEKRKALVFKSLDEFKTKFYTNITHEFRTPLTVILGMVEQLSAANSQTVGSQKDKIELIRRNGEQLLRLINRMLDLSKAQSGKLALNLRQADIADYLRYLVDSFHTFASGRDIHLRYLSEIDRLDMGFDAEKLQDVMTNLLSNAIKFTPPGGEVIVSVKWLSDGQLVIRVEDNGAGIPAEAVPHIFDRFFTAKDTGNPAGGSGIGLALTKELVELMGGSIEVKSKEGEGTAFTVTLPVSIQAPLAEHAQLPTSTMAASEQVSPSAAPQTFLLASGEDEKPLCLVIDDSADIVRYLQMLLEPEYIVAEAYDGKRGIEKALELLPDVIICDVMMPEKDGLEVCDFLKNDERTSHIPIILLTAKATVADRLEGLRRGADAYLQKPFNREELFLQLKKSVELRRKLISYFSKIPSLPGVEPLPEPDFLLEDAFLQKARAAVEKNLADEDFDIHRLCRALTMSRAQLHRKLTALTGLSATHFIRSIRLRRAKELLATTTLTVSEIAYEVGFRDPNYFSRTFAEEFGTAPSEDRKQNHG